MVIFHGELLNHQMVCLVRCVDNTQFEARASSGIGRTSDDTRGLAFSFLPLSNAENQNLFSYGMSQMSVQIILYIHYTFIIHSLYIHYTFIIHSNYTFIIHSLYIHWTLIHFHFSCSECFFFVESWHLHEQHDQLSAGGGVPGMPWYRNSFRRSHRGWPVVGLPKMVMSGQLWRNSGHLLIYMLI